MAFHTFNMWVRELSDDTPGVRRQSCGEEENPKI